METDNFDSKTSALLSWLPQVGIQINSKMEIVDLRSTGCGRGVSKLSPLYVNLALSLRLSRVTPMSRELL